MDLTPREKDKLLIFTAALLAERRRARGLKLNHPEAIALISAAIMEGARDGKSVAALIGLADRHHIVEKGRVVWTGTSRELAADSDLQHRYLGV